LKFRMRVRWWAQRMGLVGPLRVPPLSEPREGESREAFLRRALDEGLAYDEAHGELDATGRVGWLAKHLEIYVRRLWGWQSIHPAGDLRDTDFVRLLVVGAEATSAELDRVESGPAVRAAWAEVEAGVRALAHGFALDDVERLETRIAALRAAIEAERG
jgi:hypothetical protein